MQQIVHTHLLRHCRPPLVLAGDFNCILTRSDERGGGRFESRQDVGFITRKITDSLIRDTICYARDRNIRLVVLNLDFEKALNGSRTSTNSRYCQKWDFHQGM